MRISLAWRSSNCRARNTLCLLAALTASASASADAAYFVRVDFGQGISVELPEDWTYLDEGVCPPDRSGGGSNHQAQYRHHQYRRDAFLPPPMLCGADPPCSDAAPECSERRRTHAGGDSRNCRTVTRRAE